MAICNFTSARGVVSEYGIEFKSDEELALVGLFQCYSEALLQFATACCVIFMLIGIPSNLITIVALARCKKVRNATAIFIINLHTGDLIFNSIILPMSAMSYAKGHWTHGWVMCRVYAYLKYVLSSSSLSTVLAISINRYVIVCHPFLYPKFYNRRTISISILMIWTLALAIFMAPNFGAWGRFDLEPNGVSLCTMMPDKYGRLPKRFFIIAIVVPYLTLVLCYSRILWVVKTANKIYRKNPQATQPTHLPLSQTQSDIAADGKSWISCDRSSPGNSTTGSGRPPTSRETSTPQSPIEDKAFEKYFKAPFRLTRKLVRRKVPTSRDKRLCAMIAAIMISFSVSHLPIMTTRHVFKEYRTMVNVFSHLLQYSGTCINPIIYVLISKEYRQAYKSLFASFIKKFQTLKFSS